MKPFKIKLAPTHLQVMVVIMPYQQAAEYLIKRHIVIEKGWLGCATPCGNYLYLYLNEDLYTTGTIAHEAVHITNYIKLHTNIFWDATEDEMQAYWVGYIVDEIDNHRKKV